MPNPQFLNFVVDLVKLGGIGVGALIFTLIFVMMMKKGPVEHNRAELISSFMKFGCAFAAFALPIGLAQLLFFRFLDGTTSLTVTYSPSFTEAHLPAPSMVLLSGSNPKNVVPDQPVTLSGTPTLKIAVDSIISQAKDLQKADLAIQASKALATDLIKLNEQANKDMSQEKVAEVRVAQKDAANSLKVNDFVRAHLSIKKVLRSPF